MHCFKIQIEDPIKLLDHWVNGWTNKFPVALALIL